MASTHAFSSIVFIDTGIEDWQALAAGVGPGAEIVLLDPAKDGVTQIAEALTGRAGLDAVHIVSHGRRARLELGSTTLTLDTLDAYQMEWQTIGAALSARGDLLLYGCNVAEGEEGRAFVGRLADLTGADVAASSNLTGAGGDGVLEVASGAIESVAVLATALDGYAGTLGSFVGGAGDNLLTGTSEADTLTGGGGDDTLKGELGQDVAVYSGNIADFSFAPVQSSNMIALLVRDTNASDGDEGTDTLYGIETLRFADGDLQVAVAGRGPEFRVNTYTNGSQASPAVTALATGGFVVTWSGAGQDSVSSDIYAQRYDASGAATGAEFRANASTANAQSTPSIAGLSGGGFVVAWVSYGQDGDGDGIYAQRFNASGTAVGAELAVNTYTTGDQDAPAVTGLLDGGFVVTWASQEEDGVTTDICAQRFNASGTATGAEFQVNTYTPDWQYAPAVAALASGGFVVTWMSYQDGSESGIYAQRFNASGTATGAEFQINTYVENYQYAPAVAGLLDGGFVVTWESSGQDGSGSGIYAQRFNASGTATGAEFRVNTYTINNQSSPAVTALPDGGFVVSWQSAGQDGSGSGTYARRFDASGNAAQAQLRVNSHTANDQSLPAITALPERDFVVTWESVGQDGSGKGVYATVFSGASEASPPVAEIRGNASANVLKAGDGVVRLLGGASRDQLYGGHGADTIKGGSGADTLVGGAGNDKYWVDNTGDVIIEVAAGGTDLVNSHLTFSLAIPSRSELENLTLIGINAIDGTGNAKANILTGNTAANTLAGRDGNDTLNGGAGADTLRGGPGADSLVGGADNDRLEGEADNDTLNGGAGADTLVGGPGDDRLVGADGNDILIAGAGADTLVGGLGADRFKFVRPTDAQDTLTDFTSSASEKDKLVFASPNFGNLTNGTLAAMHFVSNTTGLATEANHRFIFQTDPDVQPNTGVLWYDADGKASASAPVAMATLNVSSLANTDILIVAS